jgi:hypothetical protein
MHFQRTSNGFAMWWDTTHPTYQAWGFTVGFWRSCFISLDVNCESVRMWYPFRRAG